MPQILLSEIYKQQKSDQDIFQELMPFKVQEILLVATPYDAFSFTSDGKFFSQVFSEYRHLNLFSSPHITSVFSADEALNKIKYNNYQLVIIMAGLDKQAPLELAGKLKNIQPDVPLLLLINNNSDLAYFKDIGHKSEHFNNVFVWNGDPKVFLAMTKMVEDSINIDNDTEQGEVRVILLIEDSVKYYTRYLPKLYSLIMLQTQSIIQEHAADDMHRMLKMRARPKIILCSTYEEAMEIFDRYKHYLLCVISDVAFEKGGVKTTDAGALLLKYIKSEVEVPCLMQSSDIENKEKAEALDIEFISKNSETLELELRNFLIEKCGFGDFIFKNSRNVEIDKARNIQEFVEKLTTIPPESLLYHSKRQGISKWLMARGEISLAKQLSPVRIEDFQSTVELRNSTLKMFQKAHFAKLNGQIIRFDTTYVKNRHFVHQIGNGSLGGKGRGIAFVSHLTENINFEEILPDINVRIPYTTCIGSNEFTDFVEGNDLYKTIFSDIPFLELQRIFSKATLPEEVEKSLRQYVETVHEPIAIRSSGLFEDSLLQPFAGIYSTYILPNNAENDEDRLQQLTTAIKLVYASIYSPKAKDYFRAVNYKIEEEKMAVIIQELVGETNHHRFYTQLSGVAQSYNYYPFSYMKPDDGFSVAAIGLGKYVVGGETSYRFCPKYPNLELQSLGDIMKNSQHEFYALNLKNTCPDLLANGEDSNIVKLSISEAEEDDNLKHLAQVFDYENQRLSNNFDLHGPRVVNFANILKYDHIPLAKTLSVLLDILKQALGAPVEIEYAVDITNALHNKPTFYILQIKPLIQPDLMVDFDEVKLDKSKALLMATKGMGNGRFTHITDVIYYNSENFKSTETLEMVREMEKLNKKMVEEGREYILIGPGRWGTNDRFIGIPVQWSQISHAKIIIEIGLEDFPLEASLGSHFFHNVTSMNVGYFSIPFNSTENKLQLELLQNKKVVDQTKYFNHIRFDHPMEIIMDGRTRKAAIIVP